MFTGIFGLGSLIIDVNSNRLAAVFLRETGAVFDHFSIVKGSGPAPLRVATLANANGTVRVQWKSVAGHSYQVQRSAGLESSNWQPASGVITASGATTAWTNTAPAGASLTFYRVARVAP